MKIVCILLFILSQIVFIGFMLVRNLNQAKRKTYFGRKAKKPVLAQEGGYDVIIVGAGPAGTTAGYYLAKEGRKVAIIERKSFPKVKLCGDAWCAPALDILEDMGLLEEMEKNGAFHKVTRGGFISPFGYECINTDGEQYGAVTGCRTYAMKRHIGDKYLADAAVKAGCTLLENTEVDTAVLNGREYEREWTVTCKQTTEGKEAQVDFKGNMLFICDGSTSYLAQKLGIIPKGQSEASCSHRYMADTSWKGEGFAADGVMVFCRSVLPGYSALFRHADDDVYLGTYILPGGRATSRAIAPHENELLASHSYVKKALGDKHRVGDGTGAKFQVAPIRCGGVPKSYAEACLVVGDAAGHVDPLTGEGIHTAMIAGKIAAETADEMMKKGDTCEGNCQAYHWRCYDAFVYEFKYSSAAARLIHAMPIILDAVAVVGQRRGQAFLDFFGEAMTGVRPKSHFLQPGLAIAVTMEIVRQMFLQYVMRKEPLQPQSIGAAAVEKSNRSQAKSEKSE